MSDTAVAQRSSRRTLLVVVGVVAVLGWVWFVPFSVLGTANLALAYALVAVSLVVLTGWVGQISLAQATFVGLGSFVTGVLVESWSVPFPLTLPLAAGAAAGMAALLGLVALRVRGLYLAVATLIFAWMAQEYLFNQPWLAGIGGSKSAPAEPLGSEGSIPYLDFTERRTFYFVILAALAAAVLGAANLRDSKTGRAWFAVKGSEVAAASLGIAVTRYKLLAFAVAGFLAGAAGNLVMTHQQVATASSFGPNVSLFYLAIAVVGGLTSLGGAVAAGALFASLEELFFRVEALAGFLEIVSASLLVIVLLFFPAGLAGLPPRLAAGVGAVRERAAVRRERVTGRRRAEDAAGDGEGDGVEELEQLELMEIALGSGGEEPSGDEDAGEAPAAAGETATPGGPAPRRARLSATATWLRGRLPSRPRSNEPAPDALAASLGDALAGAEPEPEPEPEVVTVPGIAYEPGTASKVDLPPRDERKLMLAARNITVRFGGLTAVDDASLEVREGEIVGLIGPNGAGKTTLFNAISGLNEPTAGTVELFGDDVTPLAVHDRAARGMGRTFQAIQLFPQLTVFDNLLVATHLRNQSGFLGNLVAGEGAVDQERRARQRVAQVVRLVGLEDVAQRPAGGLPFGVLRLVEAARALVTGSPLVMLDEPASGLDNTETDRFADLLLWMRQTLGITLLLIEHDVRMVTSVTDYMYVIDRGKLIAHGTPADVQRDEAVIAAYLGSSEDVDADEDIEVVVETHAPEDGSDADWPGDAAPLGATRSGDGADGGGEPDEADTEPVPVAARGRRGKR